ncbi:MAG: ABC transporter ATP-binding protein [Saccharofermentanales bacterium]
MDKFLTNKMLSDDIRKELADGIEIGEDIKFCIMSDLDNNAKYNSSILAVTQHRAYVYDSVSRKIARIILFIDIDKIVVKRFYGNAVLRCTMKDGQNLNIFRFSYSALSLCEAAATFIEQLNAGSDFAEELDIVSAAYEKQMSVCPKCGRALPRPGASCIYCQSKSMLVNKLLKYIAPQKKILIISLILALISTTVALLPPYMTKMLIDDIIPSSDKRKLIMIVIILLIAYIFQYSVSTIRGYMLRIAGDKIVADLRNDIYEKAQYLPMSFYDKTSTGAVINRIAGDTNTLQAFMIRITQEVITQFFLLFGIVILMFFMNWQLTILSLLPVPVVVIGARYFSFKIFPFYRRIWRRWSAVSSILTDTIPGIRVIKSFTNEKNAVKTFTDHNSEWLRTDIKAAKILNIFPNSISFLVTCGSLLIWLFGGMQVINTPQFLSLGLLVSFLTYTGMFYGPVGFFANLSDSYQGALAATERIFDIVNAEPENNFGEGNIPENGLTGRIEFKNVNFSFDRSKKILKNISFIIEPGEIVGIVGTTGSGKSTLVNLLLRFYDNYDGDILIDGINIREIDMQYFRSQIGYVQQEPMMFHDTIFNNIAYGSPEAVVEQVINAADVANAHEFIARQPDGYDTVLGERGVGLSGGERQRLSIARAVLKNPSLLVFDEATASVDSETESLIQEAIERLIKERTTIMIAHRLSTLSKANRILVVDNGEIIENGSPVELMALKGKYYKLVQIQKMTDKARKQKDQERL